jgi:Tfp pilus assembly protein PilW
MPRLSHVLRAAKGRLHCERGITLIELVTAMALAIVVIGAPLTFMIVTLHQHDNVVSRTDAARQAEVGLNQLTRDLRLADPTQNNIVLSWQSDGLGTATATFSIVLSGSDVTVVWTCTANANCTRKLGPSGAAQVEIEHVLSTTFAPVSAAGATLTSPTSISNPPVYVGITMSVQPVSQAGIAHTARPKGISKPLTMNTGVQLWGSP